MDNIIVAILFFLLSAALILIALILTFISRGFDKKYTAVAPGKLTRAEYRGKVHVRLGDDKRYDRTEYIYTYEVAGVCYQKRGHITNKPKTLPNCTDVIYQKRNPKYSYLPHFETPPGPSSYRMLYLFAVVFCFIGLGVLF